MWRDNLGAAHGVLANDSTGAATIGQAQYDLWAVNYGWSNNPSLAVPEPATPLLLLVAITSGVLGRRVGR